ncbi:MAG: TOBE domain-containing protein [Mesorhizobium sp.]|nr:MAG: TOBE domain-containing protein [Mesorhizobium sp.]
MTTQLGMTLTASHKKAVAGQKAFMSIRPEKISLPAQDNPIAVDGTIMGTNYLGGYTYYLVETGGIRLRISKRNSVSRGQMFEIGQSVKVGFAAESVRILGA